LKITKLLTGLLVVTALLAGCSNANQSSTPSKESTESKTNAEGSSDVENNTPTRVIEHAMGSTSITGTPMRVVTLFQGATDSALTLGVKPLGSVESWAEKPVYEYLRDQMEGVTNLGIETQPDLEAIIALKPDLIIASKVRHEKIYTQLSEIAPTVMVPEVYKWKETLEISGKALNKEKEAKDFLKTWDEKTAYFKEKAADQIKNKKVSIIDFRADHARIVYNGFAALVLNDMGIERPEAQKGTEWGVMLQSEEAIPQMEGDIIFDQSNLSELENVNFRNKWMANPLWTNLTAVKNNEVHLVNSVYWNSGGGPQSAMLMLSQVYEFFGVK
jgi:iron complex transport system substrate-binding protein